MMKNNILAGLAGDFMSIEEMVVMQEKTQEQFIPGSISYPRGSGN